MNRRGSAGDEAQKPRDCCQTVCDNALNERQQRIMDKLNGGERLQQKDVIGMFRRDYSPSTVKRDIKALRDMGLIGAHKDAYYVPSEAW